MRTLDIEEAKLHLAELIEQAAAGEPFVITEAGEPRVQVSPVQSAGTGQPQVQFGLLAGSNFNLSGFDDPVVNKEIENSFYGDL